MTIIKSSALSSDVMSAFAVSDSFGDRNRTMAKPERSRPQAAQPAPDLQALERDWSAKLEQCREEAYAEGRESGLAEAASREQERCEALEAGIAAARQDLSEWLDGRERDAIRLAKTLLARVLGDEAHYGKMIIAGARHWRKRVGQTALLGVTVHPDDFQSTEAKDILASATGCRAIEYDDALERGACRFALAIGEADFSLASQAEAVVATLNAHLDEAPAS